MSRQREQQSKNFGYEHVKWVDLEEIAQRGKIPDDELEVILCGFCPVDEEHEAALDILAEQANGQYKEYEFKATLEFSLTLVEVDQVRKEDYQRDRADKGIDDFCCQRIHF